MSNKNLDINSFMSKKITVRMLEANFNALPELLRYVIDKAQTDLEARIVLNNFRVASKKERSCLDPAEAVFGFGAMITQLKPSIKVGSDSDASTIAELLQKFCEANDLGMPSENWTKRLKMINTNEE